MLAGPFQVKEITRAIPSSHSMLITYNKWFFFLLGITIQQKNWDFGSNTKIDKNILWLPFSEWDQLYNNDDDNNNNNDDDDINNNKC